MTSLSTNCQAEVLSPNTYCSDEKCSLVCFVTSDPGLMVTISGVAITAVLVLTALGVLCTRRCFKVDFPDSAGPIKMVRMTSTDTELCFLRDSWYADCHSKKTTSRGWFV